MAGRAEKAVLADGGVHTNGDLGHVVAVHTLAQAGVIAHLEIPWCPDAGRWVGVHRPAQFGTEQAQQKTTP